MTATDDEHPAQRLKFIRSVIVFLGIINPSPIEKISMKLRSSLSCSGRHKTDRANYQIHAGSYG